MSYVYINSEPGLYTVGFYDPDGKWQPESDHSKQGRAAARVAWLNGGKMPETEPGPPGFREEANGSVAFYD